MSNNLVLFLLLLFLISCNNTEIKKTEYKDQIGDTTFNPSIDNPEFQFCDSTNVLHKRALIKYSGGKKALNEDLLKLYEYQPVYGDFNGYFIIRFAVNCKNETGRFRIEILDDNFNLTEYPEQLKQHVTTIFKTLDKWNHAVYRNKDYDGYTFRTLKITNGKIELL